MQFFLFLSLIIGIVIPIHTAMNSRAGVITGNAPLANIFFWVSGLIAALLISAFSGGINKVFFPGLKTVPFPLWFAGSLGAFIALGASLVYPKIGVANATFIMIIGQMLSSLIISDKGLLGLPRDPVTVQKISGLVLMTAGLALFVFSRKEAL